jgi:hypothetical protein
VICRSEISDLGAIRDALKQCQRVLLGCSQMDAALVVEGKQVVRPTAQKLRFSWAARAGCDAVYLGGLWHDLAPAFRYVRMTLSYYLAHV